MKPKVFFNNEEKILCEALEGKTEEEKFTFLKASVTAEPEESNRALIRSTYRKLRIECRVSGY